MDPCALVCVCVCLCMCGTPGIHWRSSGMDPARINRPHLPYGIFTHQFLMREKIHWGSSGFKSQRVSSGESGRIIDLDDKPET